MLQWKRSRRRSCPSDRLHKVKKNARCRALVRSYASVVRGTFVGGGLTAGRKEWSIRKSLPRGFPSASLWMAMAAGQKTEACPVLRATKKAQRSSAILPTTVMNWAFRRCTSMRFPPRTGSARWKKSTPLCGCSANIC